MAQETQTVRRFNPGSDGFDPKDVETFSKAFTNSLLDKWFESDPLAYDKAFDSKAGAGVGRNMLKLLNRNRANAFARWRNQLIGVDIARRETSE